MSEENIVARLMAENEEFQRLRTEHKSYDHELESLKSHALLSAEDHWRVSELKKLKLMAKDRMEAIVQHVRHVSA